MIFFIVFGSSSNHVIEIWSQLYNKFMSMQEVILEGPTNSTRFTYTPLPATFSVWIQYTMPNLTLGCYNTLLTVAQLAIIEEEEAI
jgi:hypothetical protein